MYKLLLLNFLLVFSFNAAAQYQHLVHKTYAQRYLALDTLFYNNRVAKLDSSEFFKEIDKIEALARKEKDQDLLLETEFLKLEYYMIGYDHNHPRFVARALSFKEKVDRKEVKHLQIRIRQKLGYYYFYIVQEYGPGFENYLESYELLQNVSATYLPEKQEMIASIGTAYFNFGEMDKARQFLKAAQNVPPSYKKRILINHTNTIGLIYRMEQNYDSAEFYFRKAHKLAVQSRDSAWMGIATGNIGITYFLQDKLQEAIPLLEFDINQSIKAHEIDNAVGSAFVLAQVYMKLGKVKESREVTQRGLSLLPITGDPKRHKVHLFELLALQYKEMGNFIKAYQYLDSSHKYLIETYDRRNKQLLKTAENKVEIERYKAIMQQAEHTKKLRLVQAISLVAGVILVAIIIILVINRKRILLKQRQEQLLIEKETIESELETAVSQLNDFTEKIREKNQLIEQYTTEIQTYTAETGQPYPAERRQALEQLMQATLLTDEQWDNFLQLFDKVHKGYLIRLREKLPDLSPADTRYVLLSKLNLSPREMASMLGVRPDAIRLYKHRLKKKLQLAENETVQDLVNNI